MEYIEFIQYVKIQTAELSIGPSTLRNQGKSGLIQKTREYLKQLALENYGLVDSQEEFCELLDKHTEDLIENLKDKFLNWGAARKAINIFLRNATYNRFLCQQYGLERIEEWLEVPIDKSVATGLINSSQLGVSLPKWRGIKWLTPQENDSFQQAAQALADLEGINKIYVDLFYWRNKKA